MISLARIGSRRTMAGRRTGDLQIILNTVSERDPSRSATIQTRGMEAIMLRILATTAMVILRGVPHPALSQEFLGGGPPLAMTPAEIGEGLIPIGGRGLLFSVPRSGARAGDDTCSEVANRRGL